MQIDDTRPWGYWVALTSFFVLAIFAFWEAKVYRDFNKELQWRINNMEDVHRGELKSMNERAQRAEETIDRMMVQVNRVCTPK